ncbi:MAG: HEAT repeat domain-containing protein [Plectolyngbya sp. WJT66-NPBG17]|jgi:HEAT repeat protein|nr:HEAT repeat domain-containing protein [Plectolyngbya sp. WJT66-NPBG17]MBW4527354.1 HEAT repeat domain-containing protein [Phormidium tanganyikae FI6-MK23]
MASRTRKIFSLASQITLLCLTIALTPRPVSAQITPADIRKLAATEQSAIASLRKRGKPAIAALTELAKNEKEPQKSRLFAIVALGELNAKAATPVLVDAIDSNSKEIRLAALAALAKLEEPGKDALPFLVTALKDKDADIRIGAAQVLENYGSAAKDVVPALTIAIADSNRTVQVKAINAIAAIGADAKSAIPALTDALNAPEREVRLAVILAVSKLGQEAKSVVPILAQLLSDPDSEIRTKTASTLVTIGADASAAVPQLRQALQNTDRATRSFSAVALGRIGAEAKLAVPELTRALKDLDKDVRSQAATALGRIGLEARSSLPELVETLKDENSGVRLNAAASVGRLAGVLQDKAAKLTATDLVTAYATLETALPILEDPKAQFNEEVTAAVRRSLSVLKNEKDSRLFERVFEWSQANPTIASILLYMLSMPSLWLTVLLIRPLWLLKLNNALQPYTDFEIPNPLGGSIKIPLRFVLFIGWLHYHPRVLDAWVKKQIEVAREAFAHKSTVSDRKVYIPIPVVMDGTAIAELSSQDLHTTFWDGRQCLLIWGEGGIGKTSLACHLAKWAMSDNKIERLSRHRMLPVLIEQELDFKLPDEKSPFREAIRGQLQALIDAAEPINDEFLEKLLRQRRILVIVDRLSELSEETRQQIRPGHPDFPANALIVTSRVEETLDEVPKTTVKPLRIEGNRLSSFLEAYLNQRNKRELFTDPEYFDACSQLSRMVGQRNITVLLAKLYAEQMIAKKEGSEGILPDNIPDLMLSYLNELNRDTAEDEPDNLIVHEDAKIIAWECLKHYYRPAPAKREAILSALQAQTEADEETVKARLKHLEKRLRIVQAIGPAQDQICFALDPLAECLAALRLVELNQADRAAWSTWLMQADTMPGAPDTIQGFLLAMRDCCLTRSADIDIPDFVMEQLGQRVGLSAEVLRKSQVDQRMRRLTPMLSAGDTFARLEAIRELGELGSASKDVLPALVREFQDRDWCIRREVARAIGNIGPEARTAIPSLVERLRDEDRRVSGEAIATLGKLGFSSIPALVSALDAKAPYVRSSAAWVLASFNAAAKPAIPALTAALKDEDWQVRWVAAYALGCIGPDAKSAIPALIEAFRGEYELVSKEASRTLWRISGEAEAIVAALGELTHGNDRN